MALRNYSHGIFISTYESWLGLSDCPSTVGSGILDGKIHLRKFSVYWAVKSALKHEMLKTTVYSPLTPHSTESTASRCDLHSPVSHSTPKKSQGFNLRESIVFSRYIAALMSIHGIRPMIPVVFRHISKDLPLLLAVRSHTQAYHRLGAKDQNIQSQKTQSSIHLRQEHCVSMQSVRSAIQQTQSSKEMLYNLEKVQGNPNPRERGKYPTPPHHPGKQPALIPPHIHPFPTPCNVAQFSPEIWLPRQCHSPYSRDRGRIENKNRESIEVAYRGPPPILCRYPRSSIRWSHISMVFSSSTGSSSSETAASFCFSSHSGSHNRRFSLLRCASGARCRRELGWRQEVVSATNDVCVVLAASVARGNGVCIIVWHKLPDISQSKNSHANSVHHPSKSDKPTSFSELTIPINR